MVKWGKYLKENRIEKWKEGYMSYKKLKKVVSALQMSQVATTEDQIFFTNQVEEEARKVQRWYMRILNQCIKGLERLQEDIPDQMKFRLDSGVSTDMGSDASSSNRRRRKGKRSFDPSKNSTDDRFSSSGFDTADDEDTTTTSSKKQTYSDDQIEMREVKRRDNGLTTVVREKDKGIGSVRYGVQRKENIIEIDTTEEHTESADEGEEKRKESDRKESEEFEDNAGNLGDDERDTETAGTYTDETSTDTARRKYPPMTLEDGVFSHLPSSAHRDCLGIFTTLARLKLFGWQNAEGIRKIIKKFDKRCNCNLTLTFWPKIKMYEFANVVKQDAYLSQCASVLTTRMIPFGNFDVRELKQKGVNLHEMALCIQQLETVTREELPEIVPMSVEPRSYMANERTFLKWMRMGALTAILGMILLGFNHEPVTGVVLLLFSIAVIIRSFHEYRRRTDALVDRVDHNWDDHLGGKLLVFSLLIPMVTYLVYLILYKNQTNLAL